MEKEDKPSKWSKLPGTNVRDNKEDDEKRTIKKYFRCSPSEEIEINNLKEKSGLSEQAFFLNSILGLLSKGYKPLKSDAMVKKPNWSEKNTCFYCKRALLLSEDIYEKDGVAVCNSCHQRIQEETMNDLALIKRALTKAGLEKELSLLTKIAKPALREFYDIIQNTEGKKEYEKILIESANERVQASKIEKFIVIDKQYLPDKEGISAVRDLKSRLEEFEKYAKRRIWEIEHNPISVSKIEEYVAMSEPETRYALTEVQAPQPAQLEDQRSNEQEEVIDVSPVEAAQVVDKRPEKCVDDPDAAKKMKDPTNIEYAEAGMDYCKARSEWMWSDPNRCADCKEKNPSLYDECLKWNQETRQKLSSDHPEREGNP